MQMSSTALFYVFAFAGIVAIFIFAVCVGLTAINLPNAIGWQNYSEAMLIDMALKAVG